MKGGGGEREREGRRVCARVSACLCVGVGACVCVCVSACVIEPTNPGLIAFTTNPPIHLDAWQGQEKKPGNAGQKQGFLDKMASSSFDSDFMNQANDLGRSQV